MVSLLPIDFRESLGDLKHSGHHEFGDGDGVHTRCRGKPHLRSRESSRDQLTHACPNSLNPAQARRELNDIERKVLSEHDLGLGQHLALGVGQLRRLVAQVGLWILPTLQPQLVGFAVALVHNSDPRADRGDVAQTGGQLIGRRVPVRREHNGDNNFGVSH